MSFPIVTIRDACELVTDGTHYTPSNIGQGIPFLTVRDLSNRGLDFKGCSFISQSDYEAALRGNSAPQPGDVLFSKDGTVGKVHIVVEQQPFAVLSSVAILRPNKSKLDSRYFGHVLKSPASIDQALKRKTGSAIRRIILSDLMQVSFPLPPIAEQKRIAAILDKADALREKRRQAIAKLDTLLQSVFLDMFGAPSKNEHKFPIVKMGDVLNLKGGYAFKSADYQQAGVPLIRIGEVNRGKFSGFDIRYLPREFLQTHYKFVLRPGAMVMSLTGTTGKDDYGNVLILDDFSDVYLLNQRVASLSPDESHGTKEYFYQLLKDQKIKAQITGLSRGIRQANISNGDLLNLQIPCPPIEMQKLFSTAFNKIKCLITKSRASFWQHEKLFQSLQHRAFNGKL